MHLLLNTVNCCIRGKMSHKFNHFRTLVTKQIIIFYKVVCFGVAGQELPMIPVVLNINAMIALSWSFGRPWNPGRKRAPVLHHGWKIKMQVV